MDLVCPLPPFAQLYTDSLTVDGSTKHARPAQNAVPLIAPFKRCCPVCAAIQHELSLLSGRSGDDPICSKHAHIYSCRLPGLASAVRERVIRKFERTLREHLDEVKMRSRSHYPLVCRHSEGFGLARIFFSFALFSCSFCRIFFDLIFFRVGVGFPVGTFPSFPLFFKKISTPSWGYLIAHCS